MKSKNSDVDILDEIKSGNKLAFNKLISKYISLIKAKISSYKILGVDNDDLLQESILALLNASTSYDDSKGASFKTYASVCIERRLISLYNKGLNKKHSCLNNYVELNENIDKSDFSNIPEDLLINHEDLSLKCIKIKKVLSKLEFTVLCLHLKGCSYDKIAKKLSISNKSVDNALQRVRKKLKNIF